MAATQSIQLHNKIVGGWSADRYIPIQTTITTILQSNISFIEFSAELIIGSKQKQSKSTTILVW